MPEQRRSSPTRAELEAKVRELRHHLDTVDRAYLHRALTSSLISDRLLVNIFLDLEAYLDHR